jgi:hypothetical protein
VTYYGLRTWLLRRTSLIAISFGRQISPGKIAMNVFRILCILTAGLVFATPGLAADAPKCSTEGYGPWQYQLYVDEPTGYAFIKTPCGWHFVRQIEKERLPEALRMARLTPEMIAAETASNGH